MQPAKGFIPPMSTLIVRIGLQPGAAATKGKFQVPFTRNRAYLMPFASGRGCTDCIRPCSCQCRCLLVSSFLFSLLSFLASSFPCQHVLQGAAGCESKLQVLSYSPGVFPTALCSKKVVKWTIAPPVFVPTPPPQAAPPALTAAGPPTPAPHSSKPSFLSPLAASSSSFASGLASPTPPSPSIAVPLPLSLPEFFSILGISAVYLLKVEPSLPLVSLFPLAFPLPPSAIRSALTRGSTMPLSLKSTRLMTSSKSVKIDRERLSLSMSTQQTSQV